MSDEKVIVKYITNKKKQENGCLDLFGYVVAVIFLLIIISSYHH